MAKRQPVVLPDYPQILLTPRRGNSWDANHIDDCFDALADHYRLKCRFSDLPSPIGVLPDKETEFWMGLAWGLVRDFVPAFGQKKYGRPRGSYTAPWLHGARLVQIVRAVRQMLKEKGLPSTTPNTFEEVARILKKKPAPRWQYGSLTKPSSFAQEWKKLPRHIKKTRITTFRFTHPLFAEARLFSPKWSGIWNWWSSATCRRSQPS
jgi:hypothetical protein